DGDADAPFPGLRSQPLHARQDLGLKEVLRETINALVASLMSRMASMSMSAETNFSSRLAGMLATSPPETTTSRTEGVLRRYSSISWSRSGCLISYLYFATLGGALPTTPIRVQ